jgi:hypothetical protein
MAPGLVTVFLSGLYSDANMLLSFGCSLSFFLSFLGSSLPLYRACHSSPPPPCRLCVGGGKVGLSGPTQT